jgi:hypothetical protein
VEQWLLTYIDTIGPLTLSRFSELARIPSWKAEKILVDLVHLYVLKYEVLVDGIFFSFRDDFIMPDFAGI